MKEDVKVARAWHPRRRAGAAWLRGLMCAAFVCVAAVTSAVGQEATYTDNWIADTSNDEYVNEGGSEGYVNGFGITEQDYSSYESYKVETSLASPNGRYTWRQSFGDFNARTDVSLPVNLDYPEEGQYTTTSNHYSAPYEPNVSPFTRLDYYSNSMSQSGGVLNYAVASYRKVGQVGMYYHYQMLPNCVSRNCNPNPNKYIKVGSWGAGSEYMNLRGFAFRINLGFVRVLGCALLPFFSSSPADCR